MHKIRAARLFVIFFTITIFSCVTETKIIRDIPEYSEAEITKIERMMQEEKYEGVICLCRNITDERLKEYEKKAIEKSEIYRRIGDNKEGKKGSLS